MKKRPFLLGFIAGALIVIAIWTWWNTTFIYKDHEWVALTFPRRSNLIVHIREEPNSRIPVWFCTGAMGATSSMGMMTCLYIPPLRGAGRDRRPPPMFRVRLRDRDGRCIEGLEVPASSFEHADVSAGENCSYEVRLHR